MSTRANIIVKGINNETNEPQYVQVYHHCDGMPSGVGKELNIALRSLCDAEVEFPITTETILKSPVDFVSAIINNPLCGESYEYEFECDDINELNPHGDLEYLYFIDLTSRIIECRHLYIFDTTKYDTVMDYLRAPYKELIKEKNVIYRMKFNDTRTIEEVLEDKETE
jgi:hypothetical protein